ncbi:MAG: hypothetical protein NTZ35_11965 [Ignavibacteriales bacterium]|nr:hypothetical protein [Ignavibacteriales bacterium]
MIPFSWKFRTNLLKRFRELVRPARAAQMYLIDAEAQCDAARQARAPLFASHLFQEASIFLHSAHDEFQHRRFAEARILANLARTRAANALTIAEIAKSNSRDDLQHQLQSTLISLGQIAKRLFHPDKHPLECIDKCIDQMHEAVKDLQTAFASLNDDDYSTARAHLGYASAMTECLESTLHDQPSLEPTIRVKWRPVPESFDHWFVKRVNEIERLVSCIQLSEAGNSAETNAI